MLDNSQIESLKNAVKNAEEGLPPEAFYLVSRLTPLINVDLLIQNGEGHTLLTWRHDNFYGPGWHVPGGIIRFKERWEDRIAAVATTELSATVLFTPQPIALHQVMNPTRDTRGHFISMLFSCRLDSNPDPTRQWMPSNPSHGAWAWHNGCPANIISAHEMYRTFIDTHVPCGAEQK